MAILKELGAPESLQIIVEGESLLNDGSALVLFTLGKNLCQANEGGREAGRNEARKSRRGRREEVEHLGPLSSWELNRCSLEMINSAFSTLGKIACVASERGREGGREREGELASCLAAAIN